MTLSEKIRRELVGVRSRDRLTLRQMGLEMGVPASVLCRWFESGVPPRGRTLDAAAAWLDRRTVSR